MGLSRLDNFLKSVRGTIIYVNPNDLDATDSIENQGNSLTRPFKTIQRALIESSRFSYQKGLDNDRFGKTTILLYPGEHTVDNRPGWIPDGANNYILRNGTTSNDLPPYDLNTNFDLQSPNNELYKLNSVFGGIIIPRGTSIVGLDLRKTKIRPKWVPSPTNDNIARSCLFRVTGDCYLWQFSIFDGNPNGRVYVDYTANEFVPNFSHHKLTCFEYADGSNGVKINDDFVTFSTTRTDLDMYYEKVGLVYGQSSGRAIEPDYPSSGLDIQPKVDEYRIVGSTGESVGITSIKAGDGVTATTSITVTTTISAAGLDVDTPFRITGITATGYDGQFVVAERPTDTTLVYTVQNAPANPLPSVIGSSLSLSSDTVTSSSPYIFNISLRSVYGMCGLLADGAKSSGFKSMVVAQFTGIGLQKDNNAFVVYNAGSPPTGQYDDNTVAGNESLSTNSQARYKPSYRNFHLKVTNNAVVQAVSVFAIGYAEHFVTDSGGDISLTNSNSNFGAVALSSKGFRSTAYSQDNVGYLTHIIPPKELPLTETATEFESIDVNKTGSAVGVGSTGNLYLYGKTNKDVAPENVIDGYRIGARDNDSLKVLVSSGGSVTEYESRMVMPDSQLSAQKIFTVNRSVAGINSIGAYSDGGSQNVITFTAAHSFVNGESVRLLSDNARIPDGLEANTLYYAITSGTGISTNTNIKLAKTLNEANNDNSLVINDKGGLLKVVSRVSDKNSGEIGHPVQWDDTNSQWYVKVSTASTDNTLYPIIVGLGSTGLGTATPRTYFNRKGDSRNINDTLYRARYVIPAIEGTVARPPSDGFIIQQSNTTTGSTDSEIQTYFGSGSLSNVNQQRNFRFISDTQWDGSSVSVTTELPHDLNVGSRVEMVNVKSTENTTAASDAGYNRTYNVTGISSSKAFTVGLTTDPGTFTNDTSARTTALPYFKKKQYENTYYIYRNSETQKYIAGKQDGIYYLTFINASNSPTVAPFTNENFSQPVKNLYPQTNRDTPLSDPPAATSAANPDLIGEVVASNPQNSISKEALTKFNRDNDIGVGITDIVSPTGSTHTIHTTIDHGLNRVTKLSITDVGGGYGNGSAGDLYNAKLVAIGSSSTGQNATVKISVGSTGAIDSVKIMDGGSAYGIGNSMHVVGVGTTTGYSPAILTVDKIYDNVGDVIRITGVSSESYSGFNNLYRITSVGIGTEYTSQVTVSSASTLTGFSTTGIGVTLTSSAYLYQTGEAVNISAFTYNKTTGIGIVTSVNGHGFGVDQKVRLVGANQDLYQGSFVVTKILDNLATPSYSFSVNIGSGTTAPTATGTMYAYPEGFASNGGNVTTDDENLTGRMVATYAGITTSLTSPIANATTDEVSLTNIANLDVNIGDFLIVNDELVRVKTTTTGTNPLYVFRGVLGTKRTSHLINSTVRKVFVNPVELRRHSIIRASGHTFEYVGFGPGNYSTAFPDKQDRSITPEEELLAQSTKKDGGINFYTGMNDKGISYSGNKRMSTITGQEEIFDTPIQTVTGEDISNLPGLDVISPIEGAFSRSIRVEGGDDNKVASEFNGPVIVNNKITSNNLESNSLFLQGDATVSRKYTVGIATPSLAGNPGDVVYYANPADGGYTGWVYSVDNAWRRFGSVSLSQDNDTYTFNQVGIATTTPGALQLQVGGGSSIFAVDGDGVGIGSTANGFALRIIGNSDITGSVVATAFTGDGSGLTNLANDSRWEGVHAGVGTGIYPTDLLNVGIGTTAPRHNLEVGPIGSASTTLLVNGGARFAGIITANEVFVTGIATITGAYDAQSSSGKITAGIITSTNLHIGVGGTVITTINAVGVGSVGIGSTQPTGMLDVQGHTKLKTYSENIGILTVYSGTVTVDLGEAQTFICTATADITQFELSNIPSESTSFTIRMDQDSTGSRSVGIDTFTDGSSSIPVYWPGGVVPIVTTTASKTDVYSFKIFNGSGITSVGMYGVIGGQNYG